MPTRAEADAEIRSIARRLLKPLTSGQKAAIAAAIAAGDIPGARALDAAARAGASTDFNAIVTSLALYDGLIKSYNDPATGASGNYRAPLYNIPSVGEPVFTPGVDQLQLFDDFESYTSLANLQATWDPAAEAGAVQAFIASGGHSGSKCWRITHNTRTLYNDTDTLIGRAFSDAGAQPSYNAFEFWLRTVPGYPWMRHAPDADSAGEKTIILNQGASGRPRMVFNGGPVIGFLESFWGGQYLSTLSPSHMGIFFSFDGSYVTGSSGTYWYVQNMNGAARDILGYLNDGNWHQIKGKLTPGTFITGNSGNGRIDIYIDGLPIMKYDGADPSRPEFGQVLVPIGGPCINNVDLGGPFNGGPYDAQGAQWKEYDDPRIYFRP